MSSPQDASAMFKLNTQFRCKRAIYQWANEEFYNNKVETAATCDINTPLDVTLAAFIATKLGKVKDETQKLSYVTPEYQPVCAINHNGFSKSVESNSPQYNSLVNEVELDFTKWLINELLAFDSPKQGRKIVGADIVVVSPSTRQVSAIRDLNIAGMIVDSMPALCGLEANIVIASFVKNARSDPLKIAGIADAPDLYRMMTCAKNMSFLLGPWQRRLNVVKSLKSKSSTRAYGSLVSYLNDASKPVMKCSPADFRGYAMPREPVETDTGERGSAILSGSLVRYWLEP